MSLTIGIKRKLREIIQSLKLSVEKRLPSNFRKCVLLAFVVGSSGKTCVGRTGQSYQYQIGLGIPDQDNLNIGLMVQVRIPFVYI